MQTAAAVSTSPDREANHVLIVQSDGGGRAMLAAHVACAGYKVTHVANAVEAEALIAERVPSLVMVEMRSAAVRPDELVRTIARALHRADVPLIALVDEPSSVMTTVAINAGATEVIAKDADRIEVIARLRNQMRIFKRHAQLTALSHSDELTGLLNRRGVMNELDRALARSRRHQQPISIINIDLDHFKAINDTLGHAAGDELLTRVAAALQGFARTGDAVGRLGGDEFIIVLPACDAAGVRRAAARLEEALTAIPLPNGRGRVAASIGTVTARQPIERDTLIDQADQAMYEHKRERQARTARASVAPTLPQLTQSVAAPLPAMPFDELAQERARNVG